MKESDKVIKNDCAQRNKLGMSVVGHVVWDTEPVFFILWAFCFYSARPRRFGEKKSDEKHRKKSTWPKVNRNRE